MTIQTQLPEAGNFALSSAVINAPDSHADKTQRHGRPDSRVSRLSVPSRALRR
jgi:hypothetical protein